MDELAIYCVDIGSVQGGAFGWAKAGADPDEERWRSIDALVDDVADDLAVAPVALGFECPLWVPLTSNAEDLTKARPGESGPGQRTRAWSGGGGAYALATGIGEVTWILRGIQSRVSNPPPAFLKWDEFKRGKQGLFLWEAFVSETNFDQADQNRHWKDARAAASEFETRAAADSLAHGVVRPPDANEDGSYEVVSLLGSAMLRTEWSVDHSVLKEPCLVVKVGEGE